MRKYKGFILVAVAILLVGLIVVAGCNNKKASTDYYPLGVGSYWEYNVTSFMKEGITKASKEIVQVIGKERVGEVESYIIDRFTLEGDAPSVGQYREYLAKTDKGVECTKRSFPMLQQIKMEFPTIQTDIVHSPTEPRFKNNLKEGDSWKWDGVVTLVLVPPPTRTVQPGQEGNNTQEPRQVPTGPPTINQIKGSMEYKYMGHETIHVLDKDIDCIKLSVLGKSQSTPAQELESTVWYAPGIGRVREEQTYFEGSNRVLLLFDLVSYNITNRELFKSK